MTKEQLIKLVTEELIVNGNSDFIDAIFSINYIAHAGDKDYQGHDFLTRWTKQIHAAINNIKVVKILFLSETEQTITWQRTLTGKHVEALKGIPASQKNISWTEMVVSRFGNGKIIEEWVVSDLAGELMLKQPKTN